MASIGYLYSMTGTCKLCLNERELRQSHILPEFMYQNIYDESPKRFYALKVDLRNPRASKSKIEQKGHRENLLCDECEGKIAKYENYAAETIYAKNKGNKAYIVSSEKTENNDFFMHNYVGFSYQELRIFLLSVLWRVIISKTFVTPTFDDTIIEKLRVAIFEEDPLHYDECGCLIQSILYPNDKLAKNFILQPYLTQNNGSRVLNLFIDGFMYSFFIDGESIPELKKNAFVKPDGTMILLGRRLFDDEGLLNMVKSAYGFFETTLKK